MKLNVGENIRRLRRAADMTQEQLADKLGVAYQSVSRWENQTTYPDMELLPVLAGIFGVTVDELLGCEESRKKEVLDKLTEKLEALLDSDSQDVEAILSVAREIRRECVMAPALRNGYLADMVAGIGCNWCEAFENSAALLAELRLASEEILSSNAPRGMKDNMIRYMAYAEDEAHITAYLDQNATKWDLNKNALLYERYLHRNCRDKYDFLRQKLLFTALDERVFDRRMWRIGDGHADIYECLHRNNMLLTFLHNLCHMTPDSLHPVTGDGSVDMFANKRLDLGIRLACFLSGTGDCEGAFIVLEDTVSLLEKLMALENGMKIGCTSPWLRDLRLKVKFIDNEGSQAVFLNDDTDDGDCYGYIDRKWVLYPFTADHGWEWFDPIRDDPRFKTYVERVKAAFADAAVTE